jgi:DNA-directed RNA polymerase specialized sigma24 family protein
MKKYESSEKKPPDRLEKIYLELPPLTSQEYLTLLKDAGFQDLPGQVLARAYRQIITGDPNHTAAKATLQRLLVPEPGKYDYLSVVRRLAKQHTSQSLDGIDPQDLVQEVRLEILKALASEQGEYAEIAWVAFIRQRFFDVWRRHYGRYGERVDAEAKGLDDEFEISKVNYSKSPQALKEENHWPRGCTRWIPDAVEDAIASIPDEFTQSVARDQFSQEPSPISGKRQQNGKQPLTQQLGVSRDCINRALKRARIKIALDLLARADGALERHWITEYCGLQPTYSPKNNKGGERHV